MRTQKLARGDYAYSLNARQDRESKPKPPVGNWPPRNDSCVCLICKETLGTLTNAHAESHGYPSKAAMIADGMVRFLRSSK